MCKKVAKGEYLNLKRQRNFSYVYTEWIICWESDGLLHDLGFPNHNYCSTKYVIVLRHKGLSK